MSLQRGIDGGSARPEDEGRIVHEERRIAPTGIVAVGTLACPQCDAPVALGDQRVKPTHTLHCPFCAHHSKARDFLSLKPPPRPARVAVRITLNVNAPAAT